MLPNVFLLCSWPKSGKNFTKCCWVLAYEILIPLYVYKLWKVKVKGQGRWEVCALLNAFLVMECITEWFEVVAWRSGNGVGRINEVTLRRALLVLGWVTCPGSTPGGGTLSRYVTSHLKPTQPFILSESINWVVSNFIGCVLVALSGECSRG